MEACDTPGPRPASPRHPERRRAAGFGHPKTSRVKIAHPPESQPIPLPSRRDDRQSPGVSTPGTGFKTLQVPAGTAEPLIKKVGLISWSALKSPRQPAPRRERNSFRDASPLPIATHMPPATPSAMDCGAFAHGRAGLCEPPALPAAKGNLTISRPLYKHCIVALPLIIEIKFNSINSEGRHLHGLRRGIGGGREGEGRPPACETQQTARWPRQNQRFFGGQLAIDLQNQKFPD